MNYIAFDAHKRYTLTSVERAEGGILREVRVGHERGAIRLPVLWQTGQFLLTCEPGSPVAVETIGNWYWIVDEIEEAGMVPHLAHARKAKLMMGSINSCVTWGCDVSSHKTPFPDRFLVADRAMECELARDRQGHLGVLGGFSSKPNSYHWPLSCSWVCIGRKLR